MNINIEKFMKLSSKEQEYLINELIKRIEDEIVMQDKNAFTEYLLEREEIKK